MDHPSPIHVDQKIHIMLHNKLASFIYNGIHFTPFITTYQAWVPLEGLGLGRGLGSKQICLKKKTATLRRQPSFHSAMCFTPCQLHFGIKIDVHEVYLIVIQHRVYDGGR